MPVAFQVVLPLESHCANFADEGPVFGVTLHVDLQMPRVRELLAADFAAKCRLVRVNQRVDLQARSSYKLLVAEFACEGRHPGMQLRMALQIARISEPSSAYFADEWLLG